MPRPAVLDVVDWKALIQSGKSYSQWIEAGEVAANCDWMESDLESLSLDSEMVSKLDAVSRKVYIVAFAEDWCGDVVRHVPVLRALELACSHVEVVYFSREEQPSTFVRFLTNGGEAVPKFVFLSENFVECGNWGPMEMAGRLLIAQGKACGDVPSARYAVKELYDNDPKRLQVQTELVELIELASSTSV